MRSPSNTRREYDLRGYGSMVADTIRMTAYREALARCIKPGAVVVDVGAGTGIMALLACQLGAARVHAIEPSDALAVARELAAANGFSDRIEFHDRPSTEVSLAQPADVLVSDLRGVLPLHGQHVEAVIDARQRLLAHGGAQIPQKDAVHVALVANPDLHAETLQIWRDGAFGLDLSPALRWAAHQVRKVDLANSPLVGEPRRVFELDYTTIATPNASGEAQWQAESARTVHGLGAWFDTVLTTGVGFSNAPDQPRAVYGQAFFPFPEPLRVNRGDRISVRFGATRVGRDYVWQWETSVHDLQGAVRTRLQQSTFHSSPINPVHLARHAADYRPKATAAGRATSRALALIEEGLTVEEIARRLDAEFPDLFERHGAYALVVDLCDWLGN
jgi:protein arginine N-methyltransferase 1